MDNSNHTFPDDDAKIEITDLDSPSTHNRTFQEFHFSPRVRTGMVAITITSIVLFLSFTFGSQLYTLVYRPQPPKLRIDTSPSSITLETVMNGVVYAVDPDRMVYALRANNGSLIWQSFYPNINWSATVNGITYSANQNGTIITAQGKNTNPLWTMHLSSPLAQPATVLGNRIYIITSNNTIDALNITNGKLLWNYPMHTLHVVQPLIISGDFIHIIADSGTLFTLRASNGTLLWQHILPQAAQVLNANGNIIYASDNNVTALHANNGTVAWHLHLTTTPVQPMVTANGIIYIASFDNSVIALNGKNGSLLWHHRLPALAYEPIIASNTIVYVHGSDNLMYILDANNGSLRWSTPGTNILSFAVVDDIAYIVTSNNIVEAIDSTGNMLWQRLLPSSPIRPLIVANGVIYTGSASGTIYAVRASDSALLWHYATQIQTP
jgi:eukaryotic-like serine/threonine-protein kinase